MAGLILVFVLTTVAVAGAQPVSQPRIVSDDPSNFTPDVLDGRILSLAIVGNMIVAGGHFSQVRAASGGPILTRNNLFAFNVGSGAISSSFTPTTNGEVRALATDGGAVFVGGTFTRVNGTARHRLVKLDAGDGHVVGAFDTQVTEGSAVYDLAVSGGRLYVGGAFSRIGTAQRSRFAAIDPITGAVDPGVKLPFTGRMNGGTGRIHRFDISPDGSRLVAVGNFTKVAGLDRKQIAMINLDAHPVRVSNWSTRDFAYDCISFFDSWVKDIDFSPDGSYFVVVTTGRGFPGIVSTGRLCDTVTRWSAEGGSGAHPVWIDYSGGDTTYSVAVTGTAIYVGGHERWWNNGYGFESQGPGAVARSGIAALDPVNGLPLRWNPGRNPRGSGVFAFLVTPAGLWFGSDTDRVAGEIHAKIAFFPLAGGTSVPTPTTATLPGTLVTVPRSGSGVLRERAFDGSSAGAPSDLSTPGVKWRHARGAFFTDGRLFTGWSDGRMYVRTFDGSSVGPPQAVDLLGLTRKRPNLFPVPRLTGMFFSRGRLYYTIAGDKGLHYRYFTPESDVIGATPFVADEGGKIPWGSVRGMTFAEGTIYFGRKNGSLYAVELAGTTPRAGTLHRVDAARGQGWASRGMFFSP